MTTPIVDTTLDLAAFLRSRRQRLDPGELGLPPRRQARRTPGLRREEVAELAGVSVDYVARLKQGRGLRPSAEVVESLARLVADLAPLPAALLNHRFDILAWNRETARLLLDLDTLPPAWRNLVWLCLRYLRMREVYVDRARVVREGIAT
ncbi:helix-turn-helix domain-containing protein [Kitasatospora sp. NPDC089509]|uniref:helix-turn-helix domain-containing protein n=1 Tax=Kitasatospora sp. NPDC089509 TaxID=3364079 RepID=UPI00380CA351